MSEPIKSKGEKTLTRVWFESIETLEEILLMSDNPKEQIRAAEVLLQYYISLGQSINEPFIPKKRRGQ